MHPARTQMEAALKAIVLPKLRSAGFRGSMPHFRRASEGKVDLLTFQFSVSGGAFVAEMAVCSQADLASHARTDLTFKNVTAHDMDLRRRLGSASQGDDHWFIYGKRNYEEGHDAVESREHYERIALQVVELLGSQAGHWWSARTGDSLIASMSPEE